VHGGGPPGGPDVGDPLAGGADRGPRRQPAGDGPAAAVGGRGGGAPLRVRVVGGGLRRAGRGAGGRGRADAAAVAVRGGQARGRAVPRLPRAAPRGGDDLPAPVQRLRAAPGPVEPVLGGGGG